MRVFVIFLILFSFLAIGCKKNSCPAYSTSFANRSREQGKKGYTKWDTKNKKGQKPKSGLFPKK